MAQEPYDEDTEYQFNEPEAEDAVYDTPDEGQPTPPPVPGGGRGGFKKKIIILIVVAIVLIFIIYKVFTVIFTAKQPKTTALPSPQTIEGIAAIPKQTTGLPTELQKATRPAPTPTTAPATTIPTAATTSATIPTTIPQAVSTAPTPATQDASSQLIHQQKENQARLSSLEEKVSGVDSNITQLQGQLQQISTQIQQNQMLRQQLEAYRKAMATTHAQRVRERKRYYVVAVIPGRAWLKGEDGAAVTVATGDKLSGYGTITSIDPYSGTVITSSGEKLLYGINVD